MGRVNPLISRLGARAAGDGESDLRRLTATGSMIGTPANTCKQRAMPIARLNARVALREAHGASPLYAARCEAAFYARTKHALNAPALKRGSAVAASAPAIAVALAWHVKAWHSIAYHTGGSGTRVTTLLCYAMRCARLSAQ